MDLRTSYKSDIMKKLCTPERKVMWYDSLMAGKDLETYLKRFDGVDQYKFLRFALEKPGPENRFEYLSTKFSLEAFSLNLLIHHVEYNGCSPEFTNWDRGRSDISYIAALLVKEGGFRLPGLYYSNFLYLASSAAWCVKEKLKRNLTFPVYAEFDGVSDVMDLDSIRGLLAFMTDVIILCHNGSGLYL